MAFLVPTLAAEKISLTDCAISGPMPSPSISVTVYLPCYVALPISKPVIHESAAYHLASRPCGEVCRATCSQCCRTSEPLEPLNFAILSLYGTA